ncbi:MAG: helix-turn-helix domain-containing protein [Cytophagaceae bacterium]|nr:helix-turn-helix domain-containing protein [Cytophagaceae bacterium]MBL0324578.1 helix-turn-helix domain-containing protein [Cytophagaceae bacterium]
MSDITREITPLTPFDCFTIFKREKTEFDFPLHFHEEFELNFILNGKGVKRTIGDHSEEIGCIELVLIGSNLPHFWQTNNFEPKDQNDKITEVTIQFHKDLLEEKFLQRNQLFFINNLFQKASKGILFSEETANNLKEKIINLPNKTGFHSVLDFFSILHELSTAPSMRLLSSATFVENPINYHSRRLEKTFDYIRKNFHKEITLDEISKLNGMTPVSFSRFIKKRTGKTFIDSLNDIRMGYATRLLIDSTESISEIAYKCGYNNISYFNRLFKSKKKLTPKEFRDNYSGSRTFV